MSSEARVFAGVDLHLSVCEKLILMQEDLHPIIKQREARVRWTAPENLHVTLKYIGEVDRSLIRHLHKAVETATAKHKPFLFMCAGLGAFPGGDCPRILHVPVTENAEKIEALASDIEEALAEIGFAEAAQPFHPWVTLGRVKTRSERIDLRDVMEALQGLKLGATEVRDVVLYESLLTPKGAQYRVLSRVHLAGVLETMKKA